MPSDAQKHFISYRQADRTWAEWIAWELEKAGYKAFLQGWHFGAGANFVQKMRRALREADRVIAVISPAYESSAFGSAEWQGAFVNDRAGEARNRVPVRVERYRPSGLLTSIVYIDLVDVDEDAARERLLQGLRGPGKPHKAPPFPLRKKGPPRYPGRGSGGAETPPEPAFENDENDETLSFSHAQGEAHARRKD